MTWDEWSDFQKLERSKAHSGERSGDVLYAKLLWCCEDKHYLTSKACQQKSKDKVKYSCEPSSSKQHACRKSIWQHHIENAISSCLHDVLERTDLSDPGETAAEQQLNALIAKTERETKNMRDNLYAHAWDEAAKQELDKHDEDLEGLLERRAERSALRATVMAVKSQIHAWGEFYGALTVDEKKLLLHATIQRIDVDFARETATVHWTFSEATAKIDLKCERTQSRKRILTFQQASNDEPVAGECGQVVDQGDSSWNLLLAELSTLSKIVEQSTNNRNHEFSSTAASG